MIKSTKATLKFANAAKQRGVLELTSEYRNLVSHYVDALWALPNDKVSKFVPKEITSTADTWASARLRQCAAKQAAGIVQGTRKKQSQRLWQYNRFVAGGQHKKARRLLGYINKAKVSKPNINEVELELDSRFVDINLDNTTMFDGWVTLTSLGDKRKLILPFKRTKHFNRLHAKCKTMKYGIRLSNKMVTFNFSMPAVEPVAEGRTIGIDIGVTTAWTASNGLASQPCIHGHDLTSITHKLTRKQKGSKAFRKAQAHRANYKNWSYNQLRSALAQGGIKTINYENIKGLRKGKTTSRFLNRFTYTEDLSKLKDIAADTGVQLRPVSPTYTSQRCSNCGWVRKANRKGKHFKCTKCSFNLDADLNAAVNISLALPPVGRSERLKRRNIKGFYWNVSRGKSIVSPAKKL